VLSHSTMVVALLAREYGHLVLITVCRTVVNLAPDGARTPFRPKTSVRSGANREPDLSELLACIRTHSDAERLRKGASAALGGKGIDVVDGSHRIPRTSTRPAKTATCVKRRLMPASSRASR
jgi:hypothetical protein